MAKKPTRYKYSGKKAGAFRSPPCTPYGSPTETIERPIGLQALPSRRSRRVIPRHGELLTATLLPMMQAGWLSARPPAPPSGSRRTNAGVCACGRTKGLSSGQTIGAARTAVRSACCLPELRGANRLRRLCPLGDGELFKFNLKSSVCQRQTGLPKGNPPCVFPSFPFGNLRIAPRSNQAPHRAASPSPAPESARQALPTYLNAFGTHSSEG